MKTMLVTGGAKRLGRAIVEHYAGKGWRVLLTAGSSHQEASELAGQLGAHVHCLKTRVGTQASAILVAKWARTYTDQIDLLVCNASSFERASVEDTTPDLASGMLESNFLGPYFLIQQCLPMLRTASGSVVTIGDAQVGFGRPHFSAYLASKAALVSMSKSMALEFAPEVRVNTILPGFLPWPEDGSVPAALQAALVKRVPMQRIGDWDDVVAAVDFLQSSPYLTGVNLPVDGGRTAVY